MSEWRTEHDRAAEARRAARLLRRPKRGAAEDFWHTLAVGLPVGAVLLVILPIVFHLLYGG